MHYTILNSYKIIVKTALGWSFMMLALLFLPVEDVVIIALYIVGMAAFILSMTAVAVIDVIRDKQEKKRMQSNPFHIVWAKNAWAKARDQGSAE